MCVCIFKKIKIKHQRTKGMQLPQLKPVKPKLFPPHRCFHHWRDILGNGMAINPKVRGVPIKISLCRIVSNMLKSFVNYTRLLYPHVAQNIHHMASSSSSLGAWGVGAASTPGMLAKSGHTLRRWSSPPGNARNELRNHGFQVWFLQFEGQLINHHSGIGTPWLMLNRPKLGANLGHPKVAPRHQRSWPTFHAATAPDAAHGDPLWQSGIHGESPMTPGNVELRFRKDSFLQLYLMNQRIHWISGI